MSQSAPKYDSQKTLKAFGEIKRTPLPVRYEAIPGDKYGRNKFIDESFDKEAKATIAFKAHDLYDTDDGFAYEVQQDFNNPVKRGELEKISVKEFGTMPQSMADYAAAKVIGQLQPTIIGKPKYEQLFKERADLAQKNKQSNIYLNASLQGKGGGTYKVGDLVLPDGATDLTKPLQGINVSSVITGDTFKSDNTKYNPVTKEVTYEDAIDGETYTIPAQKFRQIIATINTAQDLKIYDNLIQGIDKAFEKPKGGGAKNRPPLDAFIKKNK